MSWTTQGNPSKLTSMLHVLLNLLILSLCAVSDAGTETQITITLFNHPCTLKGPVDATSLKLVHAISPEQVSIDITENKTLKEFADLLHGYLDKVRDAKGLPAGLDVYREKMSRRLEAQTALFEGLDAAKKTGNPSTLTEATAKFVKGKPRKEFDQLVRKLDPKKIGNEKSRDLIEQLSDAYDKAIEPDPEELFHRAIKRINIQYMCNYEEGDEEEEEG